MLAGVTRAIFVASTLTALAACDVTGSLTRSTTSTYVADSGLPDQTELRSVPFFADAGQHCGPAALASLLVGSGVNTSPQQLAPYVFIPGRSGALQAEMKATARRNNRLAYELPTRLDAALRELQAGRPVLVLQRLTDSDTSWHYAVLVGYDARDGDVVLRSGVTAQLRMSAAEFDYTWQQAGRWSMVVLKPGELPTEASEARYVRAASAFAQNAAPEDRQRVWASGLELWPDSLTALVGLGGAQWALGDGDGAVRTLERTVVIHPDAPVPHNNLAHVLGEQGAIERAITYARRAVQLGGPHADTYRKTLRDLKARLD